jgi:Tyrosine phosphatase family
LKELGISKVFDLRSDTEIRKYNTPLPQIDGVEILHTPVFQTEDYSPEMMAKYVRDTLPELLTPALTSDCYFTDGISCMLAVKRKSVEYISLIEF